MKMWYHCLRGDLFMTEQQAPSYAALIAHCQALALVVHPYKPEQWKGKKENWWQAVLKKYDITYLPWNDEDLCYDEIMILWYGLLQKEMAEYNRLGTMAEHYKKEKESENTSGS